MLKNRIYWSNLTFPPINLPFSNVCPDDYLLLTGRTFQSPNFYADISFYAFCIIILDLISSLYSLYSAYGGGFI